MRMPEITDDTVPEVPGTISAEAHLVFWAIIVIIVIIMLLTAWL